VLTKDKVAVVVAEALGQVDVGRVGRAVGLVERGAQDGDAVAALDGEGDFLGRVGEALGSPLEEA